MPAINKNISHGIPASSGIVIGKAYVLDRHHICILEHPIPPDKIESEIEMFREAVERSNNEMAELRDKTKEEFGGAVPLSIFDSHTQILNDPALLQEVEETIEERGCNAEWALKLLLEKYENRFSKIHDGYFRERLNDIEQAITKLQLILINHESQSLADLSEHVIIVSHDLTPTDTLQMNREMVIGFAIDGGGATSHAGILASSMDIPAVVGLRNLSHTVRSGDHLIVDGNSGEVIHLPDKEQFLDYNRRRQNYLYFDQEVHAQKDLHATTTDDHSITIQANIESSDDLRHLVEHGAEGVGLYRTEYLYLNRNTLPNEEEQFEDYKKVAEAVTPYHAVIRTLDIGGDKIISVAKYYESEPNPALGLRAIRFCLKNPNIFKTQLRAILRASHYGRLKIMYPLITATDEILEANKILETAKEELGKEGIAFDEDIEVGIMIETPSSVMIADILARHCSFFSIGTNDLIQYTMAIDRVNENVAYLYQPLSPAIIRMLARVMKSADDAGVKVSVCGKMAGDPRYAMLLLGLGQAHTLSMDVHSIPRLKRFIRSISMEDCRALAKKALELDGASETEAFISREMAKYMVVAERSDPTNAGV